MKFNEITNLNRASRFFVVLGILSLVSLVNAGKVYASTVSYLSSKYVSVLHGLGTAIEFFGIAIMLVGAFFATGKFVIKVLKSSTFEDAYTNYRNGVGRAILLGLEFLVVADIVGTVAVQPTFRNLGVLGLIILIRTFLSFALEVEINGNWPWRQKT